MINEQVLDFPREITLHLHNSGLDKLRDKPGDKTNYQAIDNLFNPQPAAFDATIGPRAEIKNFKIAIRDFDHVLNSMENDKTKAMFLHILRVGATDNKMFAPCTNIHNLYKIGGDNLEFYLGIFDWVWAYWKGLHNKLINAFTAWDNINSVFSSLLKEDQSAASRMLASFVGADDTDANDANNIWLENSADPQNNDLWGLNQKQLMHTTILDELIKNDSTKLIMGTKFKESTNPIIMKIRDYISATKSSHQNYFIKKQVELNLNRAAIQMNDMIKYINKLDQLNKNNAEVIAKKNQIPATHIDRYTDFVSKLGINVSSMITYINDKFDEIHIYHTNTYSTTDVCYDPDDFTRVCRREINNLHGILSKDILHALELMAKKLLYEIQELEKINFTRLAYDSLYKISVEHKLILICNTIKNDIPLEYAVDVPKEILTQIEESEAKDKEELTKTKITQSMKLLTLKRLNAHYNSVNPVISKKHSAEVKRILDDYLLADEHEIPESIADKINLK